MEEIRCLIVEDEAIASMVLEQFLVSCGFHVIGRAAKGHEAIELARKFHPHIILMDIYLKNHIDGIEASAEILKEIDTRIIFVTASTDPLTLKRAMKIHPAGIVQKPYIEEDLLRIIQLTGRYAVH